MKQEEILTEKKEQLEFTKLKFAKSDLEPTLSEENVKFHYDTLTKAYFEKYNKTGDDFQYAGAYLHTIWWEQFSKEPVKSPRENTLKLIEEKFKSLENFKEEFEKIATSIHGSGWAYLSKNGTIKTIKNHEVKKDVLLLVDMWEHSFQHDYGSDKAKYLKKLWTIINWDIIETRFNVS